MKLRLEVLSGAHLAYDKKQLKKVLRAAGAEVAGVARKLIRSSGGGSGHYYYRNGRRVQSSAPGSPPATVTGALLSGLKVSVYRSGEGVAIWDREFYGRMLESGAQGGVSHGGGAPANGKTRSGIRNIRGKNGARITVIGRRDMSPRPFLSIAMAQREASIGERITEALLADIAFRKVKP